MNKMYLKPIVNILLLFVVFFAINGCSKDDDNNIENKTEVTLPKEAYRLQIVEAAFSEPLTQEEYDATLGEISVKLLRVDEQTLLFYIPAEVAVGSTTFTIPQLNVSQTLEVKNPELKGSEAVVLQPLFEKITTEYQDLYDPEYVDYLTTVHTSFKDYYQTLSQEEKNDMALFYQVNEDFFVKILNPDLQEKNVKETVRIIKKFSVATFFFVGGSTALSLPGTPVEKAVIGAIAVTGAIKAWDYGKQLINQITVVTNITDNLLGGKAHNQSFNKSGISFVNDQPKSINLYIGQQHISATNRSSTASGLISFFDAYDGLISATKKVNEVIRFINDHVFFANISEIPVSEIPSTSETQTEAMTEEFYSYLKFSVADTNVEITESSFEEGAIRMKMSIKNLGAVTGEAINTQLNYSYQEDFSSVTGSIPIEIKLEETNFDLDLSGTWELLLENYSCSDYRYNLPALDMHFIISNNGTTIEFPPSGNGWQVTSNSIVYDKSTKTLSFEVTQTYTVSGGGSCLGNYYDTKGRTVICSFSGILTGNNTFQGTQFSTSVIEPNCPNNEYNCSASTMTFSRIG